MRVYAIWYGDLYYGIYTEYELEDYIWPTGTRFICISHAP